MTKKLGWLLHACSMNSRWKSGQDSTSWCRKCKATGSVGQPGGRSVSAASGTNEKTKNGSNVVPNSRELSMSSGTASQRKNSSQASSKNSSPNSSAAYAKSAGTSTPSAVRSRILAASSASSARRQQCLNLRPLPQGHGSLRPVDDMVGRRWASQPMRSRSYLSDDFLGVVRGRAARAKAPRAKRQRFFRPVPAEGPLRAPDSACASCLQTREWPEKWTPAHASKAACANQLPASLSTKRTAAFEISAPSAWTSPFGADFRELAGTIFRDNRGDNRFP